MGRRVLVIENEPLLREVIVQVLSEDGLEVEFDSDGLEGLAHALCEPPDVFVIGLLLPRMNGFEILKTLRRECETQSIPIFITTDRPHLSDRKRALDLGADQFLHMPYELDDLQATLGRLLRAPMEDQETSWRPDMARRISPENRSWSNEPFSMIAAT